MGSVSPSTSVYDERPLDSSIQLTELSTEDLNATNTSRCPFEPIAIVGMGEYLRIRLVLARLLSFGVRMPPSRRHLFSLEILGDTDGPSYCQYSSGPCGEIQY